MSIEYILGVLCGILVGVILVALLFKCTKKRGSGKCQFDERQQLVRGRGFKYAYVTLAICNALYAAEDILVSDKLIDSALGLGFCVIISVAVYASYCIWNEGYFALNERPGRVMIAFSVIALVNIIIFIGEVHQTGIIENGKLIQGSLNLCCGAMLLVISVVVLLKKLQTKREAED